MEFFDEVVLSLITILFALLVVKITTSSAAGDRSCDPSRSMEVREEERSEVVDLANEGSVKGLDETVKIGGDDDAELVEFELQEARMVDLVMEEYVTKLDEAGKTGEDDAGLVKSDLQEEAKRREKGSQTCDLAIDDSITELDETVKIGEVVDELVKFDLQEEENEEDMGSQEVDSVKVEPVIKLDEPIEIREGEGNVELVKFDSEEEEKISQVVDLVIEESVKELNEPVTIANLMKFDLEEVAIKEERWRDKTVEIEAELGKSDLQGDVNSEDDGLAKIVEIDAELVKSNLQEGRTREEEGPAKIVKNDAELVKFDSQEEDSGEGKVSRMVDLVIGESVKESDGMVKIGEDDAKFVKFDLQQEANSPQPTNITREESVKGFDETGKIVEDGAELVNFDLQEDKYGEELLKELCEPVKVDEDNVDSLNVKAQLLGEVCESEIGIVEKSSIDEKEGTLLSWEDEWEGIERSELEKLFGVAVGYVGSEDGVNALSKVSSDVKQQLYGLHKVATEGPCYEQQPLALKVTARAKWHSWQRLGNMNPDAAMEQYIAILSESIPGWMGEKPGVDANQGKDNDTHDKGSSGKEVPDLSSFLHGQPTSSGAQRAFEDPLRLEEADRPTSGPNLFAKGLTKTFLFDLLSPTRVTFL